jgi:hypothetical protein
LVELGVSLSAVRTALNVEKGMELLSGSIGAHVARSHGSPVH